MGDSLKPIATSQPSQPPRVETADDTAKVIQRARKINIASAAFNAATSGFFALMLYRAHAAAVQNRWFASDPRRLLEQTFPKYLNPSYYDRYATLDAAERQGYHVRDILHSLEGFGRGRKPYTDKEMIRFARELCRHLRESGTPASNVEVVRWVEGQLRRVTRSNATHTTRAAHQVLAHIMKDPELLERISAEHPDFARRANSFQLERVEEAIKGRFSIGGRIRHAAGIIRNSVGGALSLAARLFVRGGRNALRAETLGADIMMKAAGYTVSPEGAPIKLECTTPDGRKGACPQKIDINTPGII